MSTTKADTEALERWVAGQPCSAFAQRHIHPALLAADLATAFAIGGPVQCVSAACISGLAAIGQGAALIRRGVADLVYVAGVDLASHLVLTGFSSLKALDPEGCRPFDQSRVGLSLGEGAGAIVLTRANPDDARLCSSRSEEAKISTALSKSEPSHVGCYPILGHAVTGRGLVAGPAPLIRAVGTSNDANHLTGPSRDGAGLALAIQRALEQAELTPDAIDYVHAHGTGTPFNDNMESLALRRVFGERPPPFSSSKGLLGHTLAAAGIVETILCALALRLRLMPGTPRLHTPDPIAPASLLREPQPAPRLRRILKVNCGFGGTNSALVLEGAVP